MNEANIEVTEMMSPKKMMSPKRVASRRQSIYEQKGMRTPSSRAIMPPKRTAIVREKSSQGKSVPSSPKVEKKGLPDHHKSQPSLPTRGKKTGTEPVSPSKIPLSQNGSPKKKQKDFLSPTWNSKAKPRRSSPSPARSPTAKEPASKALPTRASDQNAKGSNGRSVPYKVLKSKDSQQSLQRRGTNTSLNSKMKPDRSTLEKLGSAAIAVKSVGSRGLGKRKETGSTTSLLKTTETPKPEVPSPLPEPESMAPAAKQEPAVDAKVTESSTISPPSAVMDVLLDMTKDPSSLEQPILASLVGGVNNVSEPSSTLVTSTAAAPIELAQPEVATDQPTNGETSSTPNMKRTSQESIKVPDSSKMTTSPTIPESPAADPVPSTSHIKDKVDGSGATAKADMSDSKPIHSVRATGSPPKDKEASTSKTAAGAKAEVTKKETVRGEPDIEVLNANKLPQDASGRRNAWTKESG